MKSIFEKDLARIAQFKSAETPDTLDDALALERLAPFEKNIHEKEKLLQEALEKIPKTPEHDEIRSRVQRTLWNHSPRLDPEALKSQPFVVARNHRAWREFENAMSIYRKIYEDQGSDFQIRLEALQNKRNTLRSQQKRKDVIELDSEITQFLRKGLKSSKDESQTKIIAQALADHRLSAARAIWTEGRSSEAREIIETAIKELDGKARLDEHYFILGRMNEEKKLFREAIDQYAKIHNSEGDPTLYRRTLWAKAWMHFKLREYTESEKLLTELLPLALDLNEKLRAEFWLAEALAKSNKPKESKERFRNLSESDPFGYYGILARFKLKKSFLPLKGPTGGKELQISKSLRKIHPELAEAMETLARFQWRENLEIALNEFKPFLEEALKQKKVKEEASLKRKRKSAKKDLTESEKSQKPSLDSLEVEFMLIYAKAGIYLPLFASTTKLEAEERNKLLSTHPEILFPLDYLDLISEAAKKHQIPMELILSIIRQESAFNPLARSHAEAYGLMQMLPRVAEETGRRAGVKIDGATDLFDPTKNIEVGAAFLSDLLRNRWKGRFVPAVASYNASPKVVQNWIEVRYEEDPLVFIEDIPYEETRGYVKLVMRNFILYKQLINKKPFSFPAELIRVKD